jgi:hypothetical protein
VFDAEDESDPLFSDPNGACLALEWSDDSSLASFQNGAGRMRVADVAKKAIVEVPGTYGTSRNSLFSPESRWLAFWAPEDLSTAKTLSVARLDDGQPSAASAVANYPSATKGVSKVAFAPDAASVIYLADGTTAGKVELYLAGLGTTAGTGTKMNHALDSTGSVLDAGFTTDSSFVIYRSQQNTTVGTTPALRKIDLIAGSAPSAPIDGAAGLGVADFKVQP